MRLVVADHRRGDIPLTQAVVAPADNAPAVARGAGVQRAGVDGDELAFRRRRPPVLIAAPAAHCAGFENPATMELPSAHRDEPIGGRRLCLAGLVVAPALNAAARTQAAGVGEAGADRRERAWWRGGLTVVPETPAHDIAAGPDGAVVVVTGADRCELAGELVSALTVLVGAPASNRVVHGDSAVVPEAGRDGREPVLRRAGLAITIPTPTRRRSVLTQAACMRAAGADRGELTRTDANPAMAVRAPTGRGATRRQTAAVPGANAQAGQDVRWRWGVPYHRLWVRFLLFLLLLLFLRRGRLLLFLLLRLRWRKGNRLFDWRRGGHGCRRKHTG